MHVAVQLQVMALGLSATQGFYPLRAVGQRRPTVARHSEEGGRHLLVTEEVEQFVKESHVSRAGVVVGEDIGHLGRSRHYLHLSLPESVAMYHSTAVTLRWSGPLLHYLQFQATGHEPLDEGAYIHGV